GCDGQTDFERLIELVSRGHDDEDIDIAVGVRCTVSVGAEQDDFVRPKALGDLSSEPADDAHRNFRAAVPAGSLLFRRGPVLFAHSTSVRCATMAVESSSWPPYACFESTDGKSREPPHSKEP